MIRPRIFVIEDNHFVRELLTQNLSREGTLEVRQFDSVEECMMDCLIKPNLIILDFYLDSVFEKNMNAGEGLQLFNDRFPDIDIILISGKDNVDLLERYERLRSIEYIVKSEETFDNIYDIVKKRLGNNTNAA